MRKKILFVLLPAAIMFSIQLPGQYRYSKTDLADILSRRKMEKNYLNSKLRHDELYFIGSFYEMIYTKYRDTSIKAAIRCYERTLSLDFETEYDKNQAAFLLARIYEKGKGVPVDLSSAITYYFISKAEGLSDFNRLKEKYCPYGSVVKFPAADQQRMDSVVIRFSPFCKWTGNSLSTALDGLADYLTTHPAYSVKGIFSGKMPPMNFDYMVWLSDTSLAKKYEDMVIYLTEKKGISRSRIFEADHIEWKKDGGYQLTLQLLNEKEAAALPNPFILNGHYSSKSDHCSGNYLFKPDGKFYYEGGCEERSNIAKGIYEINGKNVRLLQDEAPLKYTVTKGPLTSNGKIGMVVVDQDGARLPLFNVFALRTPVYGDTLLQITRLQTDEKGELNIDSSGYAFISFDRFNPNRITKDNIFRWVPLSELASGATMVRFNYPAFCLQYPEIVTGYVPAAMKRVLPSDMLTDQQGISYRKRAQQ